MLHGILTGRRWGYADPVPAAAPGHRDAGAWDRRDTTRQALVGAITFLLLSLFALPARAQAPPSLRVSARVVGTAPSRGALSAALHSGPGAITQPFAQIHRLLLPGGTDSIGVVRRPSAIVTIAFLRN